MVVLSAETKPGSGSGLPTDLAKTIDEHWAAAQQELADESTAGSRETVSGAGHEIQVDRPPAVIDALEMISTTCRHRSDPRRLAIGEATRSMDLVGTVQGDESGSAQMFPEPYLSPYPSGFLCLMRLFLVLGGRG